jgi:hypothetical protein
MSKLGDGLRPVLAGKRTDFSRAAISFARRVFSPSTVSLIKIPFLFGGS